ncbi:MAG: hypothetical protein U0V02_01880 [Anaerolineales bacterium]
MKAESGEYFITLKISDAAGNESIRTAIVKVNALSFLQIIPPFTPPVSTSALPPVQTAQTDSAAVTEFGGTNSGATGTESTSTTAGGTASFNSETDYVQTGFAQESQTTNFPISTSNILWGAAATALLGATLADWQRKREEEEAKRRADAMAGEGEEGGGGGKKTPGQRAYEAMMQQKHIVGESQALLNERAREKAEQAEVARQALIAKNEDHAPVDVAKVNALVEAEIAREKLIAKNEDRSPLDMAKVNALVQQNVDATGVASVKVGKQGSEEQAINWLSSIPLVGSAINNVWQESSLKSIWEESANKSIILPGLTPKNIATAVLTVALGYNGIQWVNNIASNPNIFDDATKNLITNFQQLEEEHPHTEENSKFSYFITNPYEFVDIGYDAAKAFFNSAAGYADAIWQENPAVQSLADLAISIGDSCSTGWGEAWDRRCSAVPYFLAGIMENPADTAVGVATSLVADPTVGFIKFASYNYEYNNPYQPIADMYQSIQEYGLVDGVVNVITDRINGTAGLLSDPEVQSFGILAILALLPLAAAPLLGIGASTLAVIEGGALLLPQAANLLSQIDKALQAAPTREEAMNAVTNPQIRRQVAATAALLGLLFLGGKYELDTYNKVTTFQETLSPSAQTSLLEMSYAKQVELFNAAETLKVSPQALDFYLTESARSGSPLAWESLNTGLKYSEIYTQIQSSNAQVAVKGLPFPSQMKIFGLGERPVPIKDIPVLSLTPQEINVLRMISTENPNANYAVLGTYNGGKGYTYLAGEDGLTFLNMPNVLFDYYKNYPADFKLVNEQFVVELAEQGKPVVLSVNLKAIQEMGKLPENERPTTYWEVFKILKSRYSYELSTEKYFFEGNFYDVIVPPK